MALRNLFKKQSPSVFVGATLKMELPFVTEAIKQLNKVFELPTNKFETYDQLVQNDPELLGAIDTKATFVAKTLAGFSIVTGEKQSAEEKQLQDKLDTFHLFLRRYYYDIAFKVLKDGNACYLIQKNSTGVTSLDYLPIHALTIVDANEKIGSTDVQVLKRGVYVLNETDESLRASYPATDVIHFDLGRKERVIDLRNRVTYNVWNLSPLESLRAKLLWKTAIILNDMKWRERNVPREHHQLPAGDFNPDRFPGKTPKEKIDNAVKAAREAITNYKNQLASADDKDFPRPDQGFVTLDNVKITTVETRLKHTDPNELIDQIDKSIYSTYCPESTVSGKGRATYGTEAAIMLYTAIKAERLSEAIALSCIELAKIHLRQNTSNNFSDELLSRIVPRYNKILERHTIVRDAAILLESGAFTPTEVRKLTGFEALSDQDKVEIQEYRTFLADTRRKHIESATETATTSKRATEPARPTTPQSEGEQQLT